MKYSNSNGIMKKSKTGQAIENKGALWPGGQTRTGWSRHLGRD